MTFITDTTSSCSYHTMSAMCSKIFCEMIKRCFIDGTFSGNIFGEVLGNMRCIGEGVEKDNLQTN